MAYGACKPDGYLLRRLPANEASKPRDPTRARRRARARHGPPPAGDSRGQQFVGARAMVPHGDRRDLALSGRLQNQRQPVPPRRNHVVSVFVERDCFSQQHRRAPGAPHRTNSWSVPKRGNSRSSAVSVSIGRFALLTMHGTEFRAKRRRNQRLAHCFGAEPLDKLRRPVSTRAVASAASPVSQ